MTSVCFSFTFWEGAYVRFGGEIHTALIFVAPHTASPEVPKRALEREEALKEEEPEAPPIKKEITEATSVPDYMNCTTSRSWSLPWRDNVGLPQPEPTQSKLPEPTPSPINGFLEDIVPLGQSQHDLSQSAFLSWLSQTQQASSLLNSSVLTPDSSPGKGDPIPPEDSAVEDESATETQVAWFNLLPRAPCNESPVTTAIDQPSPKTTLQPCKPSARDQPKASVRQVNVIQKLFLTGKWDPQF